MRNNPRNIIYFAHSNNPSHHRILEKRKLFERSLTQASQYSSLSRGSHHKNRSESASLKKTENFTPSRLQTPQKHRIPIFQLNRIRNRETQLRIQKFRTVCQPRKKEQTVIRNPQIDWLQPRGQMEGQLSSYQKQQNHFGEIANIFNMTVDKDKTQSQCQQMGKSSKIQDSLASNIFRQPMKQIFLCRNCFEYFNCIEEKIHNKNCFFMRTKKEYEEKWRKLREFLNSVGIEKKEGMAKRISKMMETDDNPVFLDFELCLINGESKVIEIKDLRWLISELIIGMKTGKSEQKATANNLFSWMKCGGR